MKILLNNEEWISSDASGDNRALIWQELQDQVSSQGEIIHSLEVDGEEMLPEAFLQISGDHEFVLKTKPIRLLVRESLEESHRYLPALLKGYESIADNLEEEKTKDALELMQQAFEGTQWVLGVTQNCQVLLGESSLSDTEEGKRLRDGVSQVLEKMEKALEEQRFFEIAFLLREELIPGLNAFEEYTQKLYLLATSEVQ
jgi:molecular chaperone GrpE (heat shock protein)